MLATMDRHLLIDRSDSLNTIANPLLAESPTNPEHNPGLNALHTLTGRKFVPRGHPSALAPAKLSRRRLRKPLADLILYTEISGDEVVNISLQGGERRLYHTRCILGPTLSI